MEVRPPDSVVASIEDSLGGTVRSFVPVGGGCISNASRVETDEGTFFLKWAAGEAGQTFVAEGEGLSALASRSDRILIPRPISMKNADSEGPGLLLMDWLEVDSKTDVFWAELGGGLANLHRTEERGNYGFKIDNFIGRLPQRNRRHDDWVEFFAEERILPQVEMAREIGRWRSAWDDGLSGLLNDLSSLLPSKPHASLVHGDLWSGNVLPVKGGRASVVDPAAYKGHREVDLAMSELFGGFSAKFYDAYNAEWSVEHGYRDRRDVYNLYHLMNHLNHFGSSYAGQVAGILRRFG